MAGVRMTGLVSGLDTESLVKQLSDAYQVKVDDAKKKQTKAEWKKEAWAALNTKLLNFYKGALSTFKSVGTYNGKSVVGSLSGVKITAGSKAVNGNHKVQVKSTASAQMWTGHKINDKTYTATSYEGTTDTSKKLSELYDQNGYSIQNALNGSKLTVKDSDGTEREVTVNLNSDATVNDLLENINSQLKDTELTASFENGALKFTNQTDKEISITVDSEAHAKALGLAWNDGKGSTIGPANDTGEGTSITGSAFAYEKKETTDANVTGSSKLVDLGIKEGTSIKINGTEIVVDKTTTLSGLAASMEKAGINASYDAEQGRFYLSSKSTGTENGFTVEADDETLKALGLDLVDGESGKIAASDATIVYNGVEYTQSNNSFNINGLTFEVSAVGEEQSFSVEADVQGIYDKVKNFVKEYNSLIEEMNKLYNADSSRGYEPLTSEEKDAMTEEDIKNWEDKIKGSLLRRDSTISSLLSTMRTMLNKSVEVTNADGTTSRFSLSSFGIVTGSWSERGQLHINGNEEDPEYSGYDDLLMAAISANPDAVAQTFSSIGNEIYSYMQKAMKSSDTSSAMTFYDDKTMDGDIKEYKDEVKAMQQKLADEEEKYYKQFSAMETAMAKLQSQQTYLAQLFGG